jgi:hypothetical protein
MDGQNGWPRVYPDPCPPIRMCTSWLADCPSGHPADHSIALRSLRTLKTVSGDTMDIRRELRAQIFFPRHARLSSRFTLIGGTTNAKANAQRIIERGTLHHTENTLPIDEDRKLLAQIYALRAVAKGIWGKGKLSIHVCFGPGSPCVVCFAASRDRTWHRSADASQDQYRTTWWMGIFLATRETREPARRRW